MAEYKQLDISAKSFVSDEKKVLFQKRISVPIDKLEKLKEQAKAYRINQTEIKLLRKKKQAKLESSQQAVERNHQTVKRMYNRQRNLNSLLESAEKQVATLTVENDSLSQNVEKQTETIQTLTERLRGAYETLTNVVKAVGMLKYDNTGEYKHKNKHV